MAIRQISTNEAYSHLSGDVRAAILYVNEVANESGSVDVKDRLFRAGLRVMRAERELAALNKHIAYLAEAHQIETTEE